MDISFKEWEIIAIVNLSVCCIFFYAIDKLEVGTVLDQKISLSPSHPQITCVGKIIRATRHLDISVVGFAIQFTEIDECMVDAIDNTIKEK